MPPQPSAISWLLRGSSAWALLRDAVVFLSEIVLIAMLYTLLKPVSKTLSLAAAFARLAMAVMQGMNLLNYCFVLLLVSGAGYLTVFEPDQLHALVLLFLNAYEYVALIWAMFFALHLLVLGYFVYKSGYFPRILGIMLVVASFGYLIDSFGTVLLPQYDGAVCLGCCPNGDCGRIATYLLAVDQGYQRRTVEETCA